MQEAARATLVQRAKKGEQIHPTGEDRLPDTAGQIQPWEQRAIRIILKSTGYTGKSVTEIQTILQVRSAACTRVRACVCVYVSEGHQASSPLTLKHSGTDCWQAGYSHDLQAPDFLSATD